MESIRVDEKRPVFREVVETYETFDKSGAIKNHQELDIITQTYGQNRETVQTDFVNKIYEQNKGKETVQTEYISQIYEQNKGQETVQTDFVNQIYE